MLQWTFANFLVQNLKFERAEFCLQLVSFERELESICQIGNFSLYHLNLFHTKLIEKNSHNPTASPDTVTIHPSRHCSPVFTKEKMLYHPSIVHLPTISALSHLRRLQSCDLAPPPGVLPHHLPHAICQRFLCDRQTWLRFIQRAHWSSRVRQAFLVTEREYLRLSLVIVLFLPSVPQINVYSLLRKLSKLIFFQKACFIEREAVVDWFNWSSIENESPTFTSFFHIVCKECLKWLFLPWWHKAYSEVSTA